MLFILQTNKDPRRCGACPRAEKTNTTVSQPKCTVDTNGRELCWDEGSCQKCEHIESDIIHDRVAASSSL